MGDGECRVMFQGEAIEGFAKEEVFVSFASMMKRPLYYVEPYFSGNTVCLKSGLNRERAGQVKDSLREMGMDVWVECDSDLGEEDLFVETGQEEDTSPAQALDAGGKPLQPFGESLVKALLGPDGTKDLEGARTGPVVREAKTPGAPPQGEPAKAAPSTPVKAKASLSAQGPLPSGGPLPMEVERAELPQSERCPIKAFLLIALFSLLGGALGTSIVLLLKFQLHINVTVLTVFFIWAGTLTGVRLGDRLGGHCAKPHLVMLAVSPVSLIMFGFSFLQVFLYLLDNDYSVIWGVIESLCLFATPLLAVWAVRGQSWCPACSKPYRSRVLFEAKDASPRKLLEYLETGRIPEDREQVRADESSPMAEGQVEVNVESRSCPGCGVAVVDGVLVRKDGEGREREHVFFSRRQSGRSSKA